MHKYLDDRIERLYYLFIKTNYFFDKEKEQ